MAQLLVGPLGSEVYNHYNNTIFMAGLGPYLSSCCINIIVDV